MSESTHVEVEQGLKAASQRKTNLVWEATQSFIAVVVTVSTLYVSSKLATTNTNDTAAFLLLSNAFFLVIGFYFGKTGNSNGVNGNKITTR